jgi:repressor LexA
MVTPSQKKIFDFIRQYLHSHQIPPTLREIQEYCGYSAIGTVQDHLKNMAEAGLLKLRPRLARGISLAQADSGIPIIGHVPAGPAQLAFEEIEGYVSHNAAATLPQRRQHHGSISLPPPSHDRTPAEPNLFALKVKGDSMIEAGILDGDVVIVKPQASAKNGDIVVARVNGDEATVKRLVRKPGTIHLAPANPRHKPISVDENTAILGKVVRVVRQYA